MTLRRVDGSLVFQFQVILKGTRPPIWRRFEVSERMTLAQLHDVLQIVMGWTDSHLHRFIINGKEYGRPDYEERWTDDDPLRDERRVHLTSLIKVVPSAFLYEYDYGDGWLHVIVVERYWSAGQNEPYLTCSAGERACPPEDVGGIYGYEELLTILADPDHEEHEGMRLWAGEDFEPEIFDAKAVNRVLRTYSANIGL
jgi:hypothetical protein